MADFSILMDDNNNDNTNLNSVGSNNFTSGLLSSGSSGQSPYGGQSGNNSGMILPLNKDPRVLAGGFSAIFLCWLLINHFQFDRSNYHVFSYYIQVLAFTITFLIVEAIFVYSWFPNQSLMVKNPQTGQFVLLPTRFKILNLVFLISGIFLLFFCFSLTLGFLVLAIGYFDRFVQRGPWLVFSLFVTGAFIAGFDYLMFLKFLQSWQTYRSSHFFLDSQPNSSMANDDDDLLS